MRLPRLLTGGAVVAVLAGTAACGLKTVEPALELRDAASAFASARSVSLRLSLPSSLGDARAFSDRADAESAADAGTSVPPTGPGAAVGGVLGSPPPSSSTSPGGDGTLSTSTAEIVTSTPTSDADLRQLLSSHLDVAYDKGADASGTADDATRALLHIGGSDVAEVRTVAQVVYARVDLTAVEHEFPDSEQDIESTRTGLTGGGDPVPEVVRGPAQALVDGRWVSVDARPGSWLQQQLTASGSAVGAGVAPDAPAKLQALAGKAFGDGAVTVKRLDSDDRLGDHLVATANLRTVYRTIRGDLAGLFTGDAATEVGRQLPAVEEAPDRDLSVSFWVDDGKLSRVELDLAQFLTTPAGHLVLRADTLGTQPVAAPAGAVAVDLGSIADAGGGSLADLLADPSGAAGEDVDARTAAGWVDEDIRDMADEDGVAPSTRYLRAVREDLADSAPGVTLTLVGKRIQVTARGTTACLRLAATTARDGTVTDGRC